MQKESAERGSWVSNPMPNARDKLSIPAISHHLGWLSTADEENLIKAEGWWGRVHKLFRTTGCSVGDLKEAMINDVSAWGIISALIMTIGIGLLTVGGSSASFNPTNDDPTTYYKNPIMVIFVVSSFASSMAALASIVFASVDYVFWNAVPPELFPRALLRRFSNLNFFAHFFIWMVVSWVLLLVGVCAMLYILYGIMISAIALGVGGGLLFYTIYTQGVMVGKRFGYLDEFMALNQGSGAL